MESKYVAVSQARKVALSLLIPDMELEDLEFALLGFSLVWYSISSPVLEYNLFGIVMYSVI